MSAYYQDNKDDLLQRLRKVEGQVRGVYKMIEDDRYCVDVIMQLAAIRAALNRVSLQIIESHTRGCVAEAVKRDEGSEKIDELMDVLMKYVK